MEQGEYGAYGPFFSELMGNIFIKMVNIGCAYNLVNEGCQICWEVQFHQAVSGSEGL